MNEPEEKEYEVTLRFEATTSFVVDASSPEEAEGLARAILWEAEREDELGVSMSDINIKGDAEVVALEDKK